MASIIRTSRIKSADAIYVKQRYKDENGQSRQKLIPARDMLEARELLPLVETAEKMGLPYTEEFASELGTAAKYGKKPKNTGSLTVSDLIDLYLSYAAKKGRFKPNTLKSRRRTAENYITPFIGKVRVVDITPAFIQDFLDDLPNYKAVPGNHKSDPGYITPRRVEEVRKVLSPALRYAATRLHEIDFSPLTSDVEIPHQKNQKRAQWTDEEFLHACKVCDDPQMLVMMELMVAGPLRTGELCGLLWDCVHFSSKEGESWIEIKRELQSIDLSDIDKVNMTPALILPPITKNPKSRTCLVEWTKTSRSHRKIYLPQSVADALKTHRAEQKRIMQLLGDMYSDYNFVFVQYDSFPGRPINQCILSKRFKKMLKKYDLPNVDWYSLRGTGTTQKMRLSDNSKLIQTDMGGDSETVMMDHYLIAQENDRRELAGKINDHLFSKIDNLRSTKSEADESSCGN